MLKNKACSLMLHAATACGEVALGDPICYGPDGSILTSSSEEKRDEMVDKGVWLIWNDLKFCWLKPSTVDWCLQERIGGIYYNLNTCERGSVECWKEAVLAISRIEWRGRLVLLHQHICITALMQLSDPACGIPVWQAVIPPLRALVCLNFSTGLSTQTFCSFFGSYEFALCIFLWNPESGCHTVRRLHGSCVDTERWNGFCAWETDPPSFPISCFRAAFRRRLLVLHFHWQRRSSACWTVRAAPPASTECTVHVMQMFVITSRYKLFLCFLCG